MPKSTFFLDAEIGSLMIRDYRTGTSGNIDSLKTALKTPDDYVVFHSDFTFITVVGTAFIASVNLPSFTRNTHSWSDGGKCFITTAAVEIMGMGDNDNVLETLRAFRDGYMQESEELKALVDEYYELGPMIVKGIDESENPIDVYCNLFSKYIMPSKEFIDKGDNESAMKTYKEMVEYAKSFIGE